MTHTDIKSKEGMVAHLPPLLRPYALLMRLDRPIGTWLLLLPGWWAITLASGGVLSMNADDWKIFALFGIGAVVMRGAGCIVNDLWDRDFDRAVERTRQRPLASGAIGTRQALGLLAVLLACGFMILIQFNITAILLGLLTLPLIVTYPLMKRVTWWPQFFLGITFNAGALIGWAAVTGSVEIPALLMYVAGIFWTLGYDTIYAHQDKDDDAMIGVKSSALRLGGNSKKAVAAFYALFWALIVTSLAVADMKLIALIPLCAAAAHLMWQVRCWDMNDPASSLKFFRSNRDLGLIILLAAMV